MKKKQAFLKILVIGVIILSIQLQCGFVNIVFAEDENITNSTDSTNTTNIIEENITNTANTTEDNTANITGNNTTPQPVTPVTPVVPQKKQISTLRKVMNLSIHTYSGKERNPYVALYDGNKKLVVNRDYTIEYKNNVNPGRAIIIIKGKGDYTGTITKYFYIAPAKAKIKKVEFNDTATKATITWKKQSNASGYRVYMSNSKNGKYTRIKTIDNKKTTSYTKKGLDPTKEYYFKVRAYKQYGSIRIVKKYSEPKTSGKLMAKVTLTAHGSGANRKYNLKKACETISGLVLEPGETFNWFKVVGPASGSRGYKLASVFKAGKVAKGYGGGVCQVSSTLYQASKKVGLKIVERHIHSRPVTYTKLGNDATVSYGIQNLRIKNTKKYPVKIVMSASGESTTCKIYSLDH